MAACCAMTLAERLEKWRHLIEPETSGGLTPVRWSEVLTMPLMLVEGHQSVLLLRDCRIDGRAMRSIWVAAGQLSEVLDLVRVAEAEARSAGIGAMVFMGRRGWIRAAGDYREVATIGLKEL